MPAVTMFAGASDFSGFHQRCDSGRIEPQSVRERGINRKTRLTHLDFGHFLSSL